MLGDENIPSVDVSGLNTKDKAKIARMSYRGNKKEWLLYPEDSAKVNWDLFITNILFISCMITPWRIAFGEAEDPIEWKIINYSIDGCFVIDIIVIFFSAYYDEEFIIVEDRKQIAKYYLQGWFAIDLLAIIPFDEMFKSDNYGEFVRIARVGRMYKLIKMTRLLRILKIVKERSKLLKYLNDLLKIGLGMERLFFFVIIFFILCHIVTCVWIISGQFS